MVRGDPSCTRFCKTCKLDCLCETAGCNVCHNCRDSSHYGSTYYSSYNSVIPGCRVYKHTCATVEEQRLEQQSKITELELEMEQVRNKVLLFPDVFASEILKINIGDSANPETRYVPKNVLLDNADYFKHLFAFQEKSGPVVDDKASTMTVSLSTDVDRSDAFDRFIQFAYWKDYHASLDDTDLDLALHANVYVLAERLQSLPLKELALRKAVEVAVGFSNKVKATTAASAESEVLLNLSCIPGIIEVVYLNTIAPLEVRELETASDTTESNDPFRALISNFSASCLSKLNANPRFEECIRMFPDFAVDILRHVQDGKAMRAGVEGYMTTLNK